MSCFIDSRQHILRLLLLLLVVLLQLLLLLPLIFRNNNNQRTNGPLSLTWDPVSFWATLDKDLWAWSLVHVYLHVLLQFTIFTDIYNTDFNSFGVLYHLSIFPDICIGNQSRPLCKKVRTQLGSLLEETNGSHWMPDAVYHVSTKSANWFQKEDF